MTTTSQNVIAIEKGRRDTKKPFAWRRWGTLIAACVCVIVILPAFSLLLRNKSYSDGAGDKAMNTAEAIAEDSAAEMDMAAGSMESGGTAEDAPAEEAVLENGMADSTGTADAGSANAAAPADEAASSDMAEAVPDMEAAENKTPDTSAERTQETDGADIPKKEEEEAAGEELADGQILEDVIVRIQEVETADGESLYQAAVEQADADGLLEDGRQIVLVCDDDTEYNFLSGPRDEKKLGVQERYRVTLRYDAEGGKFAVLEAERWEE